MFKKKNTSFWDLANKIDHFESDIKMLYSLTEILQFHHKEIHTHCQDLFTCLKQNSLNDKKTIPIIPEDLKLMSFEVKMHGFSQTLKQIKERCEIIVESGKQATDAYRKNSLLK